jgi:hypothetical protein
VALVLLGVGLIQTRSTLVLDVDGQRRLLPTHAGTVGAALRQAGLDLQPEDLVVPDLESPLQAGMLITVQRAQPVTLSVDGDERLVRTRAATVGEFLGEMGMQIGPADQILLGATPVHHGTPLAGSVPLPQEAGRGAGLFAVPAPAAAAPPLITVVRATSFTLCCKQLGRRCRSMVWSSIWVTR